MSKEEQIVRDIAAKLPSSAVVLAVGTHDYIQNLIFNPATGDMVLTPATMTVELGPVIDPDTGKNVIDPDTDEVEMANQITAIVKRAPYPVDILDDKTDDANVIELKKIVHTRDRKTEARASREVAASPEYETRRVPFSDTVEVDGVPTLVEGVRDEIVTHPVRVVTEDGAPAFDMARHPLFTRQKLLKGQTPNPELDRTTQVPRS